MNQAQQTKDPVAANLSSTNFRLAVVAGASLVCSLLAILLMQKDALPVAKEDPTASMLRTLSVQVNASEPIAPLPKTISLDQAKVAIGKKLFSDPRLSRDGSISCASCHILERAGTDGQIRSFGINAAQGLRNTPTVFNSGFGFRQFWDGRALTLEEQVDGPLTNPVEMGSSWKQVIDKLKSDPVYVDLFRNAYREEGISKTSISDALATFQRALVTPNAPFDRWLRGETGAISSEAVRGYALFKSYGCISCHQGAAVGGNMFERVGLVHNFFADRGRNDQSDQGRFNQTNEEDDRHEFKVPSLRNVALTAPYFHDGSVATLPDAIRLMGYYQLGVKLPQEDIRLMEAFLQTLTGEKPEVLK